MLNKKLMFIIGGIILIGFIGFLASLSFNEVKSINESLDLQIIKQDGFETLININISKVSDSRWIIYYNLKEEVINDINSVRNGSITISSFKTKYNLSKTNTELMNSIDNLKIYLVNSTSKINVTKSIDLSVNGFFYIDFINYDSSRINDFVGQEIKIGYSTLVVQSVKTGTNLYPSLALDSKGSAHIAIADTAGTGGRLVYCNNTGGSWSCKNISSPVQQTFTSTSIAIDSNDKVHITADTLLTINTVYCNNTATAETWSCKNASLGTGGFSTSIAIDTNDKLHAVTGSNTGSSSYCNNTGGAWSCKSNFDGTFAGNPCAIALDSNNKAHIIKWDSGNSDLRYCNNTASNGAWSCKAIASSQGYNHSISIGPDDTIHISYNYPVVGQLLYASKTQPSGGWVAETVENSAGLYNSIAVDQNNIVHIGHYSTNAHRYCNNTGGWSCIQIATADATELGRPFGRAIAIRMGRLSDSQQYSPSIHLAQINASRLNYIQREVYGSCNYTSGNWVVSCNSNCTLPVINGSNRGIFNLTITGAGETILFGNISNFSYYKVMGGCTVKCLGGCFKV